METETEQKDLKGKKNKQAIFQFQFLSVFINISQSTVSYVSWTLEQWRHFTCVADRWTSLSNYLPEHFKWRPSRPASVRYSHEQTSKPQGWTGQHQIQP